MLVEMLFKNTIVEKVSDVILQIKLCYYLLPRNC